MPRPLWRTMWKNCCFSACWLLNLQLAGKPTTFIFLAGKFLVCLAGKKEQIIFSQQYWKTPENALITYIFINWGIMIHFSTNWSLGALVSCNSWNHFKSNNTNCHNALSFLFLNKSSLEFRALCQWRRGFVTKGNHFNSLVWEMLTGNARQWRLRKTFLQT